MQKSKKIKASKNLKTSFVLDNSNYISNNKLDANSILNEAETVSDYNNLKIADTQSNNKTLTGVEFLSILDSKPASYEILSKIIETTGLSLRQLALKVYEMTPKTLAQYKKKGKYFSTRNVEISFKLLYLYIYGIQLFSNNDNFNSWLQKNNYGLHGNVPMDLLKTYTGIELIYEELKRIEFGATA